MMIAQKKIWMGIGILVLLSPLGIIIPSFFGAGGAWGEWGLDEIRKLIGYVPEGMRRQGENWKAPMPDYSVPGQGKGLLGEGIGYLATAVIGVAVTAGLMYLVAWLLGRKNRSS